MQLRVLLAALVLAALPALGACTSDTSSSEQSFKCCVNKAYYDCATQEDMRTCATSKMTCPRDSSRDDQCQ